MKTSQLLKLSKEFNPTTAFVLASLLSGPEKPPKLKVNISSVSKELCVTLSDVINSIFELNRKGVITSLTFYKDGESEIVVNTELLSLLLAPEHPKVNEDKVTDISDVTMGDLYADMIEEYLHIKEGLPANDPRVKARFGKVASGVFEYVRQLGGYGIIDAEEMAARLGTTCKHVRKAINDMEWTPLITYNGLSYYKHEIRINPKWYEEIVCGIIR